MRKAVLFVIAVSIASYADSRVYYLENLDGARNNDAIYPNVEQQASRNLDLAFSAGDPLENENAVSPTTRKVSKPLRRQALKPYKTIASILSKTHKRIHKVTKFLSVNVFCIYLDVNEFKFDSVMSTGIHSRGTRKVVCRVEQGRGSTDRVLQINRTDYQKRQLGRRRSCPARRSEIDEAEWQQ